MKKLGNIKFADMILWQGAQAPYIELTIPLSEENSTVTQLKLRMPCYDCDPEDGTNVPSDEVGIADLAWVDEVYDLVTPLRGDDKLFSRKADDTGRLLWEKTLVKVDGGVKTKVKVELKCSRFVVVNLDELVDLASRRGVKLADYTGKDGVTTYKSTALACTTERPFRVKLDCGHSVPDSWGKRPIRV